MKDWDRLMSINARSVFAMTSLCVSFLKEREGSITILSGAAGKVPSPSYAVFSISKAIVDRFIECAALELAYYKVRVNGVAPGLTYGHEYVASQEVGHLSTNKQQNEEFFELYKDNIPLEGMVTAPQEVADSMVWLASDQSKYCSGEIILIDGGYSLTQSNYTQYYSTYVKPEMNKLRVGAGLMPIIKDDVTREQMLRDPDNPEGDFDDARL